MQIDNTNLSLTSSGLGTSATYGISAKDETHLMSILRKTLYSDKILAIIREYSANAWDANRAAGNGDKPILVHVPTIENPTLTIRDFGPGLSEDDVLHVYTQYGASSKRHDDNSVGALGIGSKSAFAYSDSFTVTSWYNGIKTVYISVLDTSNRGTMNKVHMEASDEPNGVEISIAARVKDLDAFEDRAVSLFTHFDPRPTVNVLLPEIPADAVRLAAGSLIRPSENDESHNMGGSWVAVMGCIPYRINLNQIDRSRLNKCLWNLHGSLTFPIGAVDFSASREELEYTDRTTKALADKFDELIDEYVLKALELIDTDKISGFEKRLRLRVLRDLEIDFPDAFETLGNSRVVIVDPGVTPYTLTHNKAAVGSVTVDTDLRFVLNDTGKSLKGYPLTSGDYVVRANDGRALKLDALETLLKANLAACFLDGVPVIRLSSLPWTSPRTGSSGPKNVKHKQTFFVFNRTRKWHKKPYSASWDAIERVPEDTDVFVVIHDFRAYESFFRNYDEDEIICRALGIPMPVVFAYKSTEKKPVDVSKCAGTEYRVWRKAFITSRLTPEISDLLYHQAVSNRAYGESLGDPDGRRMNAIRNILGDEHPICSLMDAIAASRKTLADSSFDKHVLAVFLTRTEFNTSCADWVETTADKITKAYPLLGSVSTLWYGYGDDAGKWKEYCRYIKLVDKDDEQSQVAA